MLRRLSLEYQIDKGHDFECNVVLVQSLGSSKAFTKILVSS